MMTEDDRACDRVRNPRARIPRHRGQFSQGLTDILLWVRERYGKLPVYITENGAASTSADRRWHDQDPMRVDYLRKHIRAARDRHAARRRSARLFRLVPPRQFRRPSLLQTVRIIPRRLPDAEAHAETQCTFYKDVIRTRGDAREHLPILPVGRGARVTLLLLSWLGPSVCCACSLSFVCCCTTTSDESDRLPRSLHVHTSGGSRTYHTGLRSVRPLVSCRTGHGMPPVAASAPRIHKRSTARRSRRIRTVERHVLIATIRTSDLRWPGLVFEQVQFTNRGRMSRHELHDHGAATTGTSPTRDPTIV